MENNNISKLIKEGEKYKRKYIYSGIACALCILFFLGLNSFYDQMFNKATPDGRALAALIFGIPLLMCYLLDIGMLVISVIIFLIH